LPLHLAGYKILRARFLSLEFGVLLTTFFQHLEYHNTSSKMRASKQESVPALLEVLD